MQERYALRQNFPEVEPIFIQIALEVELAL